MRRAEIESQNQYLLTRQRQFRVAADVITDAWMEFPEVQAIAVIGSVAKALWKEVPRFREFRRERIEVGHECSDLDLSVWIDSQDWLGELRRAQDRALQKAYEAGVATSVVGQPVDTFLFEPGATAISAGSANTAAVRKTSRPVLCRVAAQSRSTSISRCSSHIPTFWRRLNMRCSIGAAADGCGPPSICRRWLHKLPRGE